MIYFEYGGYFEMKNSLLDENFLFDIVLTDYIAAVAYFENFYGELLLDNVTIQNY